MENTRKLNKQEAIPLILTGFDFGNQGKAIWYKSNQRFIKAFGTIKQVLSIINPND
ncbi:hypothetical protein P4576_06935 [Peribacillus frigoritolerans]|uniref:hypothetical protein n=1 Tax=Peribacillus frigoritolerans TaxID=450367 RepID=UPI002E219D6E|nr:hypothetical protein [Peribacillus frigoritolerans]